MNLKGSTFGNLAFIIVALLVNTGCTNLPNIPKPADAAQLGWQGRFSAVTDPVAVNGLPPTRDKDSVSGQFNLSRFSNNELVLELANPLGLAVAQLRVRNGQALLQIANQADQQASNLDTLTEQAIGWRVPIDKMANWLNGKSNGPADDALFDENGRLTEASDSGWRLTVNAWREDGKPQRLLIQWPIGTSFTPKIPYTKVSLRLIVDSVTSGSP